ncbi:MAG: hypothetical protein WCG30_00645 [Candidatus Saccharibacteria bacterium]
MENFEDHNITGLTNDLASTIIRISFDSDYSDDDQQIIQAEADEKQDLIAAISSSNLADPEKELIQDFSLEVGRSEIKQSSSRRGRKQAYIVKRHSRHFGRRGTY